MSVPMTTPSRGDESVYATVPASQCFWAVLPDSSARGARGRLAQWRYAFEDSLPVCVEGVACAFARTGERVIACGVPSEDLAARVSPDTRTLCPAEVPGWVLEEAGLGVGAIRPSRLNFLVNGLEPPALRRARGRLLLQAVALVACLLSFALVGVQRRARALDARTEHARARATLAYERVFSGSGSSQPASVRLASELRALERLTTRPGSMTPGVAAPGSDQGFDAAIALSRVLGCVPQMPVDCESIEVAPARTTMSVLVESVEDAQRFAAAFGSPTPAAWRLLQPQISAVRDGEGDAAVQVVITLEPTAPVAAANEGVP